MAKQKKKRNKQYRGRDSKLVQPEIVRVQAVKRSKAGQWWYEKKRFAKPIAIAALVLFVIVLILVGTISLFI